MRERWLFLSLTTLFTLILLVGLSFGYPTVILESSLIPSEEAYSDENITGQCRAYDADDDNITFIARWFRNGSLIQEENTTTYVSEYLNKTDYVSYYKFDSINATDETGTNDIPLSDMHFNQSDALFSNAVISSGYYNNGFVFNDTDNMTTENFINLSQDFTYMFWYYKDKNLTVNQSDFAFMYNDYHYGHMWLKHRDEYAPNGLRLRWNSSGGGALAFNNLNEKTWYHISITRNSTAVYSYLNGVFYKVETSALNELYAVQGFNIYDGFNGTVDEIRVWQKDLTLTEIQSEMNSHNPVNGENLVASYSFEYFNSTHIKDTHYIIEGRNEKNNSLAYNFDGVDDYIFSGPINMGMNYSTGYTVSTWVKPLSSENLDENIIRAGNCVDSSRFHLTWDDGSDMFIRMWNSTGSFINIEDTGYSANQWYHLAFTVDNNVLRLYVDGKEVQNSTSDIYTSTTFSQNCYWYFGGLGTVSFLNGSMSETSIYKRALTDRELEEIYNESADYYGKLSSNFTLSAIKTSRNKNITLECTGYDNISGVGLNSSELEILGVVSVINDSYILPSSPDTNDDLIGYCKVDDIDNETITYYYEWYINGTINETGSNGPFIQGIASNINNLSSTNTVRGDIVMFRCRGQDADGFTSWLNSSTVNIVNSLPVMITSKIIPSIPYTNNALYGYCNATDYDNDTLKYHYEWYKNGILYNSSFFTSAQCISGNEVLVDTIDSSKIIRRDRWQLICKVDDSYINSSVKYSNEVIIENTISVLNSSLILPTIVYTNNTAIGYCNGTDLDSDDLGYEARWYINNQTDEVLNVRLDEKSPIDTSKNNYVFVHNGKTFYDVTVNKSALSNGMYGTGIQFNDSDNMVTGNFVNLSKDFTYAFWYYKEANIPQQETLRALIYDDYNQGHMRLNFRNQFAPNGLRLRWNASNNGSINIVNLNEKTWYYLTFVKNSTAVYVYINGTSYKSSDGAMAALYAMQGFNVYDNFNGSLDEIRVWQNALTGNEIQSEMNSAYPVKGEGLLVSYSFNSLNASNNTLDTNNVIIGYEENNLTSSNYFDGVDDWMYINNFMPGLTPDDDFTVSAWIKPNVCNLNYDGIFVQFTNPNVRFGANYDGERIEWGIYNGTDWIVQVSENNLCIENQWFYFVGVYHGDTKTGEFYYNGVIYNTTGSNPTTSANNNLAIGSRTAGGVYHNGSIGQVKVWDRALTNNEIQLQYNQTNRYTSGTEQMVSILDSDVFNKNDNIIFECVAKDDYDYSNALNSTGTTITNNIPEIETSRINPLIPVTTDILEGYCNASDININDNITYDWIWYKDGAVHYQNLTTTEEYNQGVEINLHNISNDNTSKGEDWIFSCRGYDGTNYSSWFNSSTVTIGNTAPVMNSSRISPVNPYTNNTLSGYCNATDINNDTLKYHYEWYKNNVSYDSGFFTSVQCISGNEILVDTILSSETTRRDRWQLICKADDGLINSSIDYSNEIIVENSIPITNSSIILPSIVYINNTAIGYCNGTDLDSDNLGYEARWYINNETDEVLDVRFDERIPIDKSTNNYVLTNNGKTFHDAIVNKSALSNGVYGTGMQFNDSDNMVTGNFVNLSKDFTFMFWYYKDRDLYYNESNPILIDNQYALGHISIVHRDSYSPNGIRIRWNATGAGSMELNYLNKKQWYHITITKNATAVSAYKDGFLYDVDYSALNELYGMQDFNVYDNFNGSIDEVRVWQKALTSDEVQDEMNSAYPVKGEKLIASYSFNSINITNHTLDTNNVVIGNEENNLTSSNYFDGVDDYISATELTGLHANNDFTTCVWVYKRGTGRQTIMQNRDALGNRYAFEVDTTTIKVGIYNGTGWPAYRRGSVGVPYNSWEYICSVFDSQTIDFTIYLNSVNVTSTQATPATSDVQQLTIGARTDGQQFWNGSLSKVKIWDRALTDIEIELQYNQTNRYTVGVGQSVSILDSDVFSVGDDILFECRAKDDYNYGNILNSSQLTINNSLPIINSRINPLLPGTADILEGYCNASDININDNITYDWIWYKDGAVHYQNLTTTEEYNQGVEINLHNISSTETLEGEDWIFSCRGHDGTSYSSWLNSSTVTIANTPPVMLTTRNVETSYYDGYTIHTFCNASDADGDNLIYYFKIFKNDLLVDTGTHGPVIQGVEVNVKNYSAANFKAGDVLTYECLAGDDNGDNSSWLASEVYEVWNTQPVTNNTYILPTNPYPNEALEGYCNVTDDDIDDSIYYEYVWIPNGVPNVGTGNFEYRYTMDENATDVNGNDNGVLYNYTLNDGLLNNVTQVSGKFGKGYDFKGGFGKYIKVDHDDSLNFTNAITMMAWINPRAYTNDTGIYQRIFSKTFNDNKDGFEMVLNPDGRTYCRFANGTNVTGTGPPIINPLDEWYHFTCTYDGTTVWSYLNGVPQASTAFNRIYMTTEPLYIGSAGGSSFDGRIDEARIWNKPLNTIEISNEMNSSYPVEDIGLVSSWSFEQGNSTHTYDTNYLVDGEIDGALRFDGVQTYVSNITPLSDGAEMTIAFWFKTNEFSGNQHIIFMPYGSSLWSRSGSVYISGTNLVFYITNTNGDNYTVIHNIIGSEGEWHHVGVTFLEGYEMKMYYDSLLVDTETPTNYPSVTGNNDMVFGWHTSGTNYFNGSLDEVIISNKRWKAVQIGEVYAQSSYAQGVEQQVTTLGPSNTNVGDNYIFSCRGWDGTEYSSWLNSSQITINESLTINDIYVTPIYANSDDDLHCNFNVTDVQNLTVDVLVTWYNGTTAVTGYDYTFVNVTLDNLYTTGIGTGSLSLAVTKDYESWKCGITASTSYSSIVENSSVVNLYPLENLNIEFPPNNKHTQEQLNVSFNVTNLDGGINCTLNVNNTLITQDNVTSGVTTYINYTLATDGVYSWNIGCVALGHPEGINSTPRTYIYDTTAPTYTGYSNNQTAITPEVGDTIRLNVTVGDFYTVDSCKLSVNDDGSWNNISTYVVNTNYTYLLEMDYIIPSGSNVIVYWKVWCNDTAGNAINSLIQNYTVKDITLPEIAFGPNNGFTTDNLTIKTSYLENLSLDVRFADENLENVSVVINCTTNGTIYNWSQTGIATKTYNHTAVVSLIGMAPQTCDIIITAIDKDGSVNINIEYYTFYIGGYINLSSLNRVDNGTYISNYTVTIVAQTATPDNDGSKVISGTTGYYTNLTNGTHQITITHSQYFTQIYNVVIVNQTQTLVYNTFQSVVYIESYEAKTGASLIEQDTTITRISDNLSYHKIADNVTTSLTFYLNASDYSYLVAVAGYFNATDNFTLIYQQNLTLRVYMSFIANFSFVDERTRELFNISGASNIELLINCPDDTNIPVKIENHTQAIPIVCNFTSFRVLVEYGFDSYYRNFLFTPEDIQNITVYLIDLTTTDAVYTAFFLDDLLDEYEDTALHVRKIMEGKSVTITADYITIEDKVGTYLIRNHEYIVEVHSSNNPVQVLGKYIAESGGDKNLRLYEISIGVTRTGVTNAVKYNIYKSNSTGDDVVYAYYKDDENRTTDLMFLVWEGGINETLLYNVTSSDPTYTEFYYNATGNNNTLVAQLLAAHPDNNMSPAKLFVGTASAIALDIFNYVGKDFMNWFITILLGVVAIMGTIRTANILSIVLIATAALFVAFGWFGLSWSIIIFAALVSLISILKGGDKDAGD